MTEPILQFFGYAHLPPSLQEISSHFGVLARKIVADLPRNPERSVALRKLLEAKDAAVRAKLYSEETPVAAGTTMGAVGHMIEQIQKTNG